MSCPRVSRSTVSLDTRLEQPAPAEEVSITGSAQGANGRGEGRRSDRGRFSSRRKTEAVLRLLRGEELDALSRELGVTAATLAQRRDRFLAAGEASLKSRPSDDRDEEIHRLQAKVGEITMENELLLERARSAEAGLPLARRRSRS